MYGACTLQDTAMFTLLKGHSNNTRAKPDRFGTIHKQIGLSTDLQRVFPRLSHGLEDNVLENSIGRWADTVATYCPGRPSQLVLKSITKHRDRGKNALYFSWSKRQNFSEHKTDAIFPPTNIVYVFSQRLTNIRYKIFQKMQTPT